MKFLHFQLTAVGDFDLAAHTYETAHIILPRFFVASAVLRWADVGRVEIAPINVAALVFSDWRSAHGGLQAVVNSVPRSGGWQRLLAIDFSMDFVCQALRGEWDWITEVHRIGFSFIKRGMALSAHGLLISFCVCLAEIGRSPQHTKEMVAGCREALNRCGRSWVDSVIADEPWDAPLSLLFLCVYAYEVVVNNRYPSVADVNFALLDGAGAITD